MRATPSVEIRNPMARTPMSSVRTARAAPTLRPSSVTRRAPACQITVPGRARALTTSPPVANATNGRWATASVPGGPRGSARERQHVEHRRGERVEDEHHNERDGGEQGEFHGGVAPGERGVHGRRGGEG